MYSLLESSNIEAQGHRQLCESEMHKTFKERSCKKVQVQVQVQLRACLLAESGNADNLGLCERVKKGGLKELRQIKFRSKTVRINAKEAVLYM